jgi:hypothetical protein
VPADFFRPMIGDEDDEDEELYIGDDGGTPAERSRAKARAHELVALQVHSPPRLRLPSAH